MKNLDVFGRDIKLTYEGEPKVSTNFGRFLSILMALICLAFFWILGQEVIYRKNPNIIIDNPKEFDLPYMSGGVDKDWDFSIVFTDTNLIPKYDPRMIQIFFQNGIMERPPGGNQTILKSKYMNVTKCDPNSNFPSYPEAKDSSFGNYGYCLDPGQGVEAGGSLEMAAVKPFKVFRIIARMCINGTSPYICRPKEEIEKFLSMGFISIRFYDSTINLQEYENPVQKFLSQLEFVSDSKMRKNMKLLMQTNKIVDDVGFLTTVLEERQFFSYKNFFMDAGVVDPTNQVFLVMDTFLTTDVKIYNRNYLKVYTIIAQVGGLLNIVKIIFKFIGAYYSTVVLNTSLLNKIYNFPTLKNEDAIESSNNFKLDQSTFINVNKSINTNKINNYFLNDKKHELNLSPNSEMPNNDSLSIDKVDAKISEYLEKKEKNQARLILGFFDIMLMTMIPCCLRFRKKPDFDIYFKLENLINLKLEVFNILNLEEELRKLKMIILSPEQLDIFNYLPKPDYGSKRRYSIIYARSMRDKSRVNINLYKSYKVISKEEHLFSQRLVNFLDPDTLAFFKSIQ